MLDVLAASFLPSHSPKCPLLSCSRRRKTKELVIYVHLSTHPQVVGDDSLLLGGRGTHAPWKISYERAQGILFF